MVNDINRIDPAWDPYAVLQVNPRACREVITAAHRALVHHCGTHEMQLIRELNDARDVLLDDASREECDAARQAKVGEAMGNYRLEKLIAEGGFGKTYLAHHLVSGRPVCIKHCSGISPQIEKVLQEEADAVWDLRHHGLPVMRDMLRLEDGSLALVMSYIPGITLEELVDKLKNQPPLDLIHVVGMMERIFNILNYLHYHGIVHGDLKPRNVIFQPQTHMLVLVDFGLAAIRPTSKSRSKGHTEYYSPPEQLAGDVVTPGADYYSLGMTMLYVLGGIEAVRHKRIPTHVPAQLREFIEHLIVRDVAHRPRPTTHNLFEDTKALCLELFGHDASNLEPIPGL